MRRTAPPASRFRPRLVRLALTAVALAAMLATHLCAGLTSAVAAPLAAAAQQKSLAHVATRVDCDHGAVGATPDPAHAPAGHPCAVMCCAVAPAPAALAVSPAPTRAALAPMRASTPWASLSRAPPAPPPRV